MALLMLFALVAGGWLDVWRRFEAASRWASAQ